MGKMWLVFFIVLGVLAVVFNEDFALVLLYLLIGAWLAGSWWSRRALDSVDSSRSFVSHAFLGEKIPVRIDITNRGLLPVVWLQARESLPAELPAIGTPNQVISLGPRGQTQIDYTLDCRKRGYYPVGPLDLFSGDLLGLSRPRQVKVSPDYLTVFPRIVSLRRVKIPSHSPLGALRHTQPVFEDPSRVIGKRDYITGDSLRRVDWKATASTRRLQVKLFEPSIALETMIFLNLNANEYDMRSRYEATELGIVAAASLANWIVRSRQAAGLATNGLDPFRAGGQPLRLNPRCGAAHLIQILETLARLKVAESIPLVELLNREIVHLAWGASLILITNRVDDRLFDGLFQARRRGLIASLVLCGMIPAVDEMRAKATYFGYPLYTLLSEKDLSIWQQ
jgi:uncharacterized protein (DUF58 family)